MSPAVERREYSRQHSTDRPDSLVRSRHSPHRRNSPRSERFSPPGTSSPRARSPNRNNYSNKGRSPVKEKQSDRFRSPKQTRRRSPSSSPSPRTKRLRRVQAERETQKLAERDHGKNSSREEHDKGRHRERGEARDAPSERSMRNSHDDGSSRSSRRDGAVFTDLNYGRRHGSRSPLRASKSAARDEVSMSRATEKYGNGDFDSVSKMKATEEALEAKDKQKPSFELSGKLAEETNRVRGITLLFNEPPDACKPDIRWRLYVFKAGEVLNEPLYVHRQSCYLFGRERRVADIPTDHPSCSKQHAVLQYRSIDKEQGELMSKQARPYLMDLGSTNAGSMLCFTRTQPAAEWLGYHFSDLLLQQNFFTWYRFYLPFCTKPSSWLSLGRIFCSVMNLDDWDSLWWIRFNYYQYVFLRCILFGKTLKTLNFIKPNASVLTGKLLSFIFPHFVVVGVKEFL